MVLILKTCGCGLTLKTGTIIIGVLQALGGFAVLVSESVSAYRTEDVAPFPSNEVELPRAEVDGLKTYVKDRKELCVILAITGAIQLILSILLLYGADYDNPKLIRPWVIFSMIMTGVMMLTYIGLAILTFVWGFDRIGSRIFLGLILASGVGIYFLLVVHSFYRYLVELQSPCII